MMRRSPSVAIVGAGMSGLCMAAMLHQAGITDISILEKADEVGGTWRDNTYPGLSCDIPSVPTPRLPRRRRPRACWD